MAGVSLRAAQAGGEALRMLPLAELAGPPPSPPPSQPAVGAAINLALMRSSAVTVPVRHQPLQQINHDCVGLCGIRCARRNPCHGCAGTQASAAITNRIGNFRKCLVTRHILSHLILGKFD